MNPAEYARMRAVEDEHWWYRGLRRLVWDTWSSLPHGEALPVLDIGCGTGGTLAGAPCRAVGVDRSMEALRLCSVRNQRWNAQSDAAALPFADGRFSGALLLDVLYHRAVGDPVAVLREARRVIIPGGHILVNVPAYEWLRSSHDDAIHTGRRFSRPQLKRFFDAADFEAVRISYWNSILFPAAATVRLARRNSRRESSDLEGYRHGPGEVAAGTALAVERGLMRVVNLPFGLSLFAVVRRPG